MSGRRAIAVAAFTLVCIAVIYLSVCSGPTTATVPWMPRYLALWLDGHDFIKNLLGFFVLGITGMAAVGGERPLIRPWRLAVVLTLFVVCLELIQLKLPHRVADVRDVLAGWVAILLALACDSIGRRIAALCRTPGGS